LKLVASAHGHFPESVALEIYRERGLAPAIASLNFAMEMGIMTDQEFLTAIPKITALATARTETHPEPPLIPELSSEERNSCFEPTGLRIPPNGKGKVSMTYL
jgi:hypothetical protein